MTAFPTELEVTVSGGYDYSTPNSLFSQNVSGAKNNRVRDYRYGNTPFNLMIITDRAGHALWSQFYRDINQGADKFTIDLDSYDGVTATHTGQIQLGSISIDGTSDPKWTIGFTFIAEQLPRLG